MKRTTMRINTATQPKLAHRIAKCMDNKTAWSLDGEKWIIESFKPIGNTKQITVYLRER